MRAHSVGLSHGAHGCAIKFKESFGMETEEGQQTSPRDAGKNIEQVDIPTREPIGEYVSEIHDDRTLSFNNGMLR